MKKRKKVVEIKEFDYFLHLHQLMKKTRFIQANNKIKADGINCTHK